MLQANIANRNLASMGEEIGHELGIKMVKDFREAHPDEDRANYIGRNIIEKILEQPHCAGICFFNAINEMGKKTLVYAGVDMNKRLITEYTTVNTSGELHMEKGIVADRSVKPSEDEDWFFGWFD